MRADYGDLNLDIVLVTLGGKYYRNQGQCQSLYSICIASAPGNVYAGRWGGEHPNF